MRKLIKSEQNILEQNQRKKKKLYRDVNIDNSQKLDREDINSSNKIQEWWVDGNNNSILIEGLSLNLIVQLLEEVYLKDEQRNLLCMLPLKTSKTSKISKMNNVNNNKRLSDKLSSKREHKK